MSAKRTLWNEFSSSMASAVIYLSTGRKFILSKYIFDSLVRNVDSSIKFYMYPRFLQPMIRAQVGDLSSHTTKYSSPVLIQKVFANMRRVGKGFSGVETPLFKGMIVAQQADDVADEVAAGVAIDDVPAADAEPTLPSPTPTTQPPPPSQELPSTSYVIPTPPSSPIAQPTLPPQQQPASQPRHDAAISLDLLHTLLETCTTLTRKVEALEQDKILLWMIRRMHPNRGIIVKIDANKDVILKDVVVVAKEVEIQKDADDDELEPTELKEVVVVTTAKLMTKVVTAAAATITTATTLITAATTLITTATITVAPSAARRRKGVVIKDPKETVTPSIIIHSKPKSKDKGKRIMVEEPKPLKKQAQIEQDEAYKEDNAVLRYQALKRKPQTEAQAKKNMMIYLTNMAGFKMDYFKGMSYDDIRPIFKKYFNSNVAFLEKTKEQLKEEESRALKRKIESSEEKAVKKKKLDEEVEEIKKHLHIVQIDEDDVYTEATPLARKVPVIDYEIYTENNKPYYKIMIAYGSHQLFLSFLSLLKNFDREDLEMLWQLVKERFASSKPKNFSDDFLLTTFTYMFEKPDVQAQMILLVERRYPLTRFTLDQMMNNVRLKVKEESEASLELLRFIRQQKQEGFIPE
uniref:Uncharacterized protein n=1 Tax=Tanacetum cinerariifolium TaxID=118510 RepID=A0A6L2M8A2_TANCI|nr:hypothetical protein [Tanacetum cinerariifolium]